MYNFFKHANHLAGNVQFLQTCEPPGGKCTISSNVRTTSREMYNFFKRANHLARNLPFLQTCEPPRGKCTIALNVPTTSREVIISLETKIFLIDEHLHFELSLEDEIWSGSRQRRRSADAGSVGDAESHTFTETCKPFLALRIASGCFCSSRRCCFCNSGSVWSTDTVE